MLLKKLKNNRGFTLIEVLLVVAIIAILAGIVIIAVNPSKQLADSRNAQRRADVQTILNALYQYSIDAHGLPDGLPEDPVMICSTDAPSCPYLSFTALTDGAKYLTAMPKDPKAGNENTTGYTFKQDESGRITIAAPNAERDVEISATR